MVGEDLRLVVLSCEREWWDMEGICQHNLRPFLWRRSAFRFTETGRDVARGVSKSGWNSLYPERRMKLIATLVRGTSVVLL